MKLLTCLLLLILVGCGITADINKTGRDVTKGDFALAFPETGFPLPDSCEIVWLKHFGGLKAENSEIVIRLPEKDEILLIAHFDLLNTNSTDRGAVGYSTRQIDGAQIEMTITRQQYYD